MSDNNRELIQYNTPNNIAFEVKSYITGREKQAIEAILYDGMNIDGDGSGKMKMNLHSLAKQNNEAINQIVVSLDGNNENVMDRVLDLRVEDYEFILNKVNEITSPISAEKKMN